MFNRRKAKKLNHLEVTTNHFDRLPDEMILHLFGLFSTKELYIISQVSSRFNRIATDECLWGRFVNEQLKHAYPNLTTKMLYRLSLQYQFLFEGQENNYLTQLANDQISLIEINDQLTSCFNKKRLHDNDYSIIKMDLADNNQTISLKPIYVPVDGDPSSWEISIFCGYYSIEPTDLKGEAKYCSWVNAICIMTDNTPHLIQLLDRLNLIFSQMKSPFPLVFIATTKDDIDTKRFVMHHSNVSVIEIISLEDIKCMDESVEYIQNRMGELKQGLAHLQQLHLIKDEPQNTRCLIQ